MKEIRLYDEARKPAHWSGWIAQGQFAVSHFDYKTGTWRTATGEYSNFPEEETILLFDSFADAELYCREEVERKPALFCRIYDQRGTAEGTVAEIYARQVEAREDGPQACWRKIRNGGLHLLLGVFCVAFDWWLGGPVILGVVVGSKFLISGTVRVIQGVAGLLEAR